MRRPTTLLTIMLAIVAAGPSATAVADDATADLERSGPIAAYLGWEAWSVYDDVTGRYALALRRGPAGSVRPAPLPTSARPWDVALGPDANGRVSAVYQRCSSRGCDVRRLSPATGREQTLRSLSSPQFSEATPAIWGSTVVFTRRIRGCDVPYVKILGSPAPSRRLLRAKCVQTRPGHASIRGTRIVISSQVGTRAGRKSSELRRYSSGRAGSHVLLEQGFGEESNLFGQVSQDERFATTVRYGVHPADTFVRVAWATGRVEEVRALRDLIGSYAKAAGQRALHIELQGDLYPGCDGFTSVPCRLVAVSADPFSGVVRRLAPDLTVAYEGTPRRGRPLTFSGALIRRVVSADEIVGSEPIGGVVVELYRRIGSDPERFEATGLRATTAPDGAYRIVLPDLGGDPFFTAVATTPDVPTWAGRGTVGSAQP